MKVRHLLGAATAMMATAVGTPWALAAAGGGAPPGGSGSGCSFYYAEGAGDGVLVSAAAQNLLPLTNEVDSEGPSADALVNSGASAATAGAPYPGDSAYSAPGLAGLNPSAYPLAAKSNYPTTPHAQVGQGPVSLTADSGPLSSRASAVAGGGSAGGSNPTAGSSQSQAAASCGAKGITADADSETEAFSAPGGSLRIGRIHSEAHASLTPDGRRHLTSSLSVGQVTVAGQTIEINPAGLSAGGQTVPLPNPLADVLRSQGISLTYVAPSKDSDGRGITAPGLQVALTLPLNQAGQGTSPTVVTYTFGRSYARVDGGFQSGIGAVGGPGIVVAGPSGTSGPAAPAAGAAPVGGAAGGIGPGTAPIEPAGLSPPQSGGSRSSGQVPVVATANLPDIDWALVYIALAVGGLGVAGAGLLVRNIGERRRWM